MDIKNILTGLLSTAYKMDHGKIAELIEAENATETSIIEALLAEDAVRVSNLKKQNADNKDSFNQGYAKAKQLERAAFEQEMKDALEVDSTNTGLDLINDIIAAKVPAGKGAAELTDEDVKKHTIYQTMERRLKSEAAAAKTAAAEQIATIESQYKANETFNSVRDKAGVILETLNPIFAKNPNVANTIKNQFFNELKGYGYEKQSDGTYLPTKDGKIVDDGHGHTKGFEDLVKEIAGSYFEFQENNGGANAGNQNREAGGNGGGAAAKAFKSEKEAMDYANDASVPLADRMAALDAYNATSAQ